MNIYYLGLKDTTVQYTNFFRDKILVKSKTKNRFDCFEDIIKKECDYNLPENFIPICNFYDQMIDEICKEDKNARFMLYNSVAQGYMKNKDRLICINDLSLIEALNDKPNSRKILEGLINILDYKYLKGEDINFENIDNLFNHSSNRYVVQQFNGFAGFGTFCLGKDNEKLIINKLEPKTVYSVSKYLEDSISINNTYMISEDDILIFDGSVQNILLKDELLYDGWDFEKYNAFDKQTKMRIYEQTLKIATKLKELGYRGIGGVDYIISSDKIYFMEINPRFQSSSEWLDKILQERGFISIFELQYLCFYDKEKFKHHKERIEKEPKF